MPNTSITLNDLKKNIDALLEQNPEMGNLTVIKFDFLNRRDIAVEEIQQYHYLVSANGEKFIYDSMEELKEDNMNTSTSKIKKVIML